MAEEKQTPNTKICPTCGTRMSEQATRCPVCGHEMKKNAAAAAAPKAAGQAAPVSAARMPQITLSLPAALGLLLVFLALGAALVFFGLRTTGRVAEPTPAPTATTTATITPTPTVTLTPTPAPTNTPLPPREYTVQAGDTCVSIAAFFGVSVQSIVTQNGLSATCNNLFIGQVLEIPYPTPTVTPPPTNTPEPAEATRQACDRVNYTVQENDTLSSIAANYAVPIEAVKEWNGLTTDNVFLGQTLVIPLCMRAATPGPSPTPTPPPPYPAPNLLLPADGAAFTLADNVITLQWTSVGTLRDNEAYMVTVEDVTADQGRKVVDYVTDTKYIVPVTFRPNDDVPHVMRWWVIPVRQTGVDDNGEPIWTPAGSPSDKRVFSWQGANTAP